MPMVGIVRVRLGDGHRKLLYSNAKQVQEGRHVTLYEILMATRPRRRARHHREGLLEFVSHQAGKAAG
jgi:hypothetical protein